MVVVMTVLMVVMKGLGGDGETDSDGGCSDSCDKGNGEGNSSG